MKTGRSMKEDREEYRYQYMEEDREEEIRQGSNSHLGAQRRDTDSDKYIEDEEKIGLESE